MGASNIVPIALEAYDFVVILKQLLVAVASENRQCVFYIRIDRETVTIKELMYVSSE